MFGALASAAAAFTVLLYWLVRRDRPNLSTPPQPPSTPDGVTQPGGGPPVAAPSDTENDGCQISCGDSCSSAASGVCDDAFNNVCQQPMDDVCGGTADSCNSGSSSCDAGSSSCDSGSGCQSTVAGSHLFQMLAGGQIWMSAAATPPRDRVTLPARIGISVIRGYQRHMSQRLGTRCRFTPSCSEYGVEALSRYGALDGAMLTVARIRRCTVMVPFGTLDPA